jgi:hypothetical protein
MPDDEGDEANGRLHADLVLWEDARRRADTIQAHIRTLAKGAPARAYWAGYAARMEAHAAALGKKLMPPTKEAARDGSR